MFLILREEVVRPVLGSEHWWGTSACRYEIVSGRQDAGGGIAQNLRYRPRFTVCISTQKRIICHSEYGIYSLLNNMLCVFNPSMEARARVFESLSHLCPASSVRSVEPECGDSHRQEEQSGRAGAAQPVARCQAVRNGYRWIRAELEIGRAHV